MSTVNSKVKYELWRIMVYQSRFISCNKCPTLVRDIEKREGYICVGTECIWEIFVPFLNFAVNLKLC